MRAIHQKSDSLLRWAVLVCGCIALISNYYCYDNPAALKTQLIQSTGMSEEQFALVYSVYSLPNIVLPFFGGHLCDVFGPGPCLVVFSLCLVAGQVIFALGVSTSSVSIVLVGRAVYGLGGENMTVALSTLLASWFRGKEMALAMGLFVALARLGSVFNNFASPIISRATNISTAIWFGAVLLGAGVAACCTIVWAERAVARQMRRGRFPPSDSPPPSAEALSSTASSVNGQPGTETASMATPLVGAADDESPKTTHNPFAAILRFRVSFWLLTVCCLTA